MSSLVTDIVTGTFFDLNTHDPGEISGLHGPVKGSHQSFFSQNKELIEYQSLEASHKSHSMMPFLSLLIFNSTDQIVS